MGFLFLKFRNSLSAQMFLAFTILIFFITISFIALFIHRQNTILLSDLEVSGKLLARILAYQSRIGVFAESEEILREEIESLLQHETVLAASVYNADGKVIAEDAKTPTDVQSATPKEMPEKEREGLNRAPLSSTLIVSHLENTMIVWGPVAAGGVASESDPFLLESGSGDMENRPLGYVRIVLDKTPLKQQFRRSLINTGFMGIGFLGIGALVTYLLAKRITRPLTHLAEGIRKFGEDGVSEKLPVETGDEIGSLAASFNTMADKLLLREAETKQLEQQLRQTQKMEAMGTLAGGIAHDFNNILGIISGYTELASIDAPQGSRLQKCLKEIFTAGKRARDLVQQILTFSRQSANEPKPLQIGLAVKEVMKMLRATLPSTIEVKYDIPRKLPAVIADPTQIHQVVMNLCTNASHAMQETGGTLEVTLEEVVVSDVKAAKVSDLLPGRYQKLSVRDTGHGMKSEVMDRIFDPFFTTKQPGEGTGLGLSVVHGIAKRHGGAIEVYSTPGKGTTFEVYFPSLEETTSSHEEEWGPTPIGSEHILLVDDETAMAEMARQMLESLGYRVTTRTSSIEALLAFKDDPGRFDLVITDMTMPHMTGAELSQEILKLRPDMPIILCTGYSERMREETAKAIGIREFVMKPIILREIAQIIRRVVVRPADVDAQ